MDSGRNGRGGDLGGCNRGACLEAAWLSLCYRVSVSLDDFVKEAQGWDVYGVRVGTNLAGAILVKGPEIHACILPFAKGKWFKREHFRLVNRVIDEHGYAQTHATTAEGEEFVSRLGFVRHGKVYRRSKPWALKQS